MIDILDILSPHKPFVFTGGAVPTVVSCSPNQGTTAGNSLVTITGTGFLDGATVTFDGSDATVVTVVSTTTITCRTPAHALGAVDIVVTNLDTQSGTLTNGYTYITIIPRVDKHKSPPYFGLINRGTARQGSSHGGLM